MKLGKHIVRLLQYKSVKLDAPSSLRSEVITKYFGSFNYGPLCSVYMVIESGRYRYLYTILVTDVFLAASTSRGACRVFVRATQRPPFSHGDHPQGATRAGRLTGPLVGLLPNGKSISQVLPALLPISS